MAGTGARVCKHLCGTLTPYVCEFGFSSPCDVGVSFHTAALQYSMSIFRIPRILRKLYFCFGDVKCVVKVYPQCITVLLFELKFGDILL